MANTLHAIGIEASGIELLIHVSVDAVETKGDLLLTMDPDKIGGQDAKP